MNNEQSCIAILCRCDVGSDVLDGGCRTGCDGLLCLAWYAHAAEGR